MAERTVAFVDLAGFVALSEAHGASTAADLATHFGELARHAATPPAQILQTIGDAVMLAAPDPDTGLTATIALVAACLAQPEFPIARAGIDHSEVEARDGDLFGPAVNVAARLTSYASGPQVLLTEPVLAAAAKPAGSRDRSAHFGSATSPDSSPPMRSTSTRRASRSSTRSAGCGSTRTPPPANYTTARRLPLLLPRMHRRFRHRPDRLRSLSRGICACTTPGAAASQVGVADPRAPTSGGINPTAIGTTPVACRRPQYGSG